MREKREKKREKKAKEEKKVREGGDCREKSVERALSFLANPVFVFAQIKNWDLLPQMGCSLPYQATNPSFAFRTNQKLGFPKWKDERRDTSRGVKGDTRREKSKEGKGKSDGRSDGRRVMGKE